MQKSVSKARAKKIRTREKQAERSALERVPLLQRPALAYLIVVALWVATVLILFAEQFAGGNVANVPLLHVCGDAVFLLVGLFATALLIKLVAPDAARSNARVLLLALIALLAVIVAKLVFYGAQTTFLVRPEVIPFLLPLAMAPLMGTILLHGVLGALIGLWPAMAMAIMLDRSFAVLMTGMLVCAVAAQISDKVRTRSKVVRAGLVVGLSQVTAVLAVTALNWRTTEVMLVFDQAFACLLSGFVSALLVLLILPSLESLFHVTTNLTLLELTDLSHPLLQRLAIEAPGTYHHSLVVANLAQVAANDIGANPLLTRVCAYFHDIGKLTKPEFFSENIQRSVNPHDDLPPSMSTLVITAHVKEGMSLAMMHKLPDPVKAVIMEHHGTSLVSWFHHKAKQNEIEGGNGARVDEASFRYPGPRPSFRESAIIGLADAVEAASRSIEKTTPGHIEQMVTSIVNKRLTDGQLDTCGLTLDELTRIKRSFVFTLTNMLHGRVPYPQDESNSQQQAKTIANGQADNRGAGKQPDAPGGASEPGKNVG